jgi:hypothetical protein
VIAGIAKSFFIAFGIACLAQIALAGIQSTYVAEFLRQNIVSIQIGLLAINAATLGIVLTKLRDLIDKGIDASVFARARNQMLLSIKEQVALIVAALVILSIAGAKALPFTVAPALLDALLLTCFVYSLMILYDTAKSVFVVLEH